MPLLAEYLKIKGFKNAYSLAPDEGAKHLVEGTARVLRGDFGFFVKKRDRKTGETRMELKDLDVEGKKAIVFDDIISSGGTTAKAVSGLRQLGASKVAAACTHGSQT